MGSLIPVLMLCALATGLEPEVERHAAQVGRTREWT